MKSTLKRPRNEEEEVRDLHSHCEDADRKLALAQELRRDADRDVFLVLEDFSGSAGSIARGQFLSPTSVLSIVPYFIFHRANGG